MLYYSFIDIHILTYIYFFNVELARRRNLDLEIDYLKHSPYHNLKDNHVLNQSNKSVSSITRFALAVMRIYTDGMFNYELFKLRVLRYKTLLQHDNLSG